MNEPREAKLAWQSLVTTFGEQSLISLFGEQLSLKAVLKKPTPETTLIKPSGIHRAVVFCVCLSFGLLLIIGSFFALEGSPQAGLLIPWEKIPRPIFQGLLILLGMLFLYLAALSAFARNSVLIEGNRNRVTVHWGMRPFSHTAVFPLDSLHLVLYQLNKRRNRLPVLGLEMLQELRRVQIASTKWRSDLAPLFESVKFHFGDRFVDKTMRATATKSGASEIVRTPIRAPLNRGRSRTLQYKGDALCLQSKTAKDKLLLLSPILAAIFASLIDFCCGPFEPMLRWCLGIGVLILGVAVFYARRRAVILMRNGWMQLPGCANEGPSLPALHAKDVVGVQICAAMGKGEYIPFMQTRLKDFPVYQVNLIVQTLTHSRVNLLTDTNLSRAYASAIEIAQFLGVTVIDHH